MGNTFPPRHPVRLVFVARQEGFANVQDLVRDRVRRAILMTTESYATVAAAAGIARPTLSAWLRGHRNMSSDHLIALLNHLGFDVIRGVHTDSSWHSGAPNTSFHRLSG